jgi:hypothetical protein
LLNLIERKGYGIRDSMYCLLVDRNGVPGYELLDGMGKVLQMLGIYEQKHAVTVIVMKGKNKPTSSMISAIAVENSYSLYDDELSYLGSRQNICVEENKADCLSNSDEDLFAQDYDTQLREEKIELSQKLIEMKKRRQQPDEHIEGDTDVDDLFCHSDSDDDGSCFIQMVLPEDEPMQEKRRKLTPVRKGPTERAHCSTHISEPACYVPSSDSGSDGDLREEDDDGAAMAWAVPSGRKSRAKKKATRVWYDEDRLQPEDQLCLKMCFTDVYQFRRALQNLHIAQLRNFAYHRNGPNRVIAECSERKTVGCKFHMTGSTIGKEKTFCLRKLNLQHTCATSGERCKVTGKWVAKVCERNMRMDTRTSIETVMDTAKEKYGVEVGKVMAYRARKRALEVVLGDQVKQYKRIRDYLQAVIDTNPGSRCIVTTKELVEHPSPNPRFHGMFVCLNGSKEGFLNGCRPFIGIFPFVIYFSIHQYALCTFQFVIYSLCVQGWMDALSS